MKKIILKPIAGKGGYSIVNKRDINKSKYKLKEVFQ